MSSKLNTYLILDRCPHCSMHKPRLENVGAQAETKGQGEENKRVWRMYSCAHCGGVTLAWASAPGQFVQETYPSRMTWSDSIPSPAIDYLQQAVDSLHAPAGAVMLAASSVDAMLKAKSYKEGSLYSRIDKAKEDHIITEGMAEWAHEVRLDANEPRHADEKKPLPREADAQRSVDFAKAFAEFLFVLPAKVQRGLAQAKSTAQPTDS